MPFGEPSNENNGRTSVGLIVGGGGRLVVVSVRTMSGAKPVKALEDESSQCIDLSCRPCYNAATPRLLGQSAATSLNSALR